MVARQNTEEMKVLHQRYATLFMLSVWGFVIVITSFIFLYAGYWIDNRFGTQPTFMLGLFMLALFLSMGRFFWEAWEKRNIN